MLLVLTATEIMTKMEVWNYHSGQKNKSPGECQVWKMAFLWDFTCKLCQKCLLQDASEKETQGWVVCLGFSW